MAQGEIKSVEGRLTAMSVQEEAITSTPFLYPLSGVEGNTDAALSPPRALIVDDNPIILKTAAAMMRIIGFQVTVAYDGGSALFEFQESAYDLLLTDFAMPLINGYQIGRFVKTRSPKTKVIIMTGLCQAEVADFMKTGGMDAWLFKPFGLKDLNAILHRVGLPHSVRRTADT